MHSLKTSHFLKIFKQNANSDVNFKSNNASRVLFSCTNLNPLQKFTNTFEQRMETMACPKVEYQKRNSVKKMSSFVNAQKSTDTHINDSTAHIVETSSIL